MKKLFIPILFVCLLPVTFSCNSSKLLTYALNERDAATAIRELLSLGATNNSLNGAFGKDVILSGIFPQSVQRVLNTLNLLGLTGEVDRFTNTLSSAAEKTAAASVPVFVSGVNNMKFTDAISIIKTGGSSATDYLRASIGDSLRRAIRPQMQTVLDEYKLNDQWNNLVKPIQSIFGTKVKPDLAGLMSVVVADAMFKKMAEKEIQVRTDASARTTPLLQKVFSRSWN